MGIFRQFPYTNFHDLNLDWLLENMRKLLEEWAEHQEKWEVLYDDVTTAFDDFKAVFDEHIAQYDLDFQEFINSIDVNAELTKVFNKAIADGTMDNLIRTQLSPVVTAWLQDHVTIPEGVVIDSSLSIAGACADAKATGDILKSKLEFYTRVINVSNYQTYLPDSNNVVTNTAYRLNFAKNSTSFPTNLPFTAWESDNEALLLTFVTTPNSRSAGDYQLLITSENIYTRNYGLEWFAWNIVGDSYMLSSSQIISAGNYPTLLPDLNNIDKNVIYRLNFAKGSTNIPDNTPFVKWNSSSVALLISCVQSPNYHIAGDVQILITSDDVFIRNYTNTWTTWNSHKGKTYTVDINGSGDYTSFFECIIEAVKTPNSTVYVKRGSYDAIAELIALKGADYFTNFDYARDQVKLWNGIHIIGEAGATIRAIFDTPISGVADFFSPIDIDAFDVTIENIMVVAKNCRYACHDDQWDRAVHYNHIFKNVWFKCDNTGNIYWTRKSAFGGGLGRSGHIEFTNCMFDSGVLDGTAFTKYGSLSFHNSPADGQSDILINNCFFLNNSTFRFTYLGTSTNKSYAFVSGCSMGRPMEHEPENSSATIDNVQIIDCFNQIRS